MTAPFAQQIQPVIDALVAAIVPIIAVGGWLIIVKLRTLITQLQMNHAATAANTETLNTVVQQTNGINTKLQAHSEATTNALLAAKDATLEAKDATIAALKKTNGGTSV